MRMHVVFQAACLTQFNYECSVFPIQEQTPQASLAAYRQHFLQTAQNLVQHYRQESEELLEAFEKANRRRVPSTLLVRNWVMDKMQDSVTSLWARIKDRAGASWLMRGCAFVIMDYSRSLNRVVVVGEKVSNPRRATQSSFCHCSRQERDLPELSPRLRLFRQNPKSGALARS